MESFAKRFDRKIESIKMYCGANLEKKLNKESLNSPKHFPKYYHDKNGTLIEVAPGVYKRPCVRTFELPRPHPSKYYF